MNENNAKEDKNYVLSVKQIYQQLNRVVAKILFVF